MNLLLAIIALALPFTTASPRTVGGRVVSPKDVQWLIKIEVGEKYRCDALYLNNKNALTLASCLAEFNEDIPRRVVYLLEAYYLFDASWSAEHVYKHPFYVPGVPEYDVAIVALNSLVPEYLVGQALTLPEPNEPLPSGVLSAFVSSSQGYTTAKDVAYLTELNLYPVGTCQSIHGPVITDSFICAGDLYANTCKEDNGAPLYVNGKLYGIRAYGTQVCGDGMPTAFIQISNPVILEFIKDVAGV